MKETDINQVKLSSAKKKNGHKLDCDCHICENMKNKAKRGGYEEEANKFQEKMMGGSKKKNGHRKHCVCPICKNMKNAKKGGEKNMNDDTDDGEEKYEGGRMKNKGGEGTEEVEIEEKINIMHKKKGNGHKNMCKYPICKNMSKSKKGGDDLPKTKKASNEKYQILNEAVDEQLRPENIAGGTRKNKGRKNRKDGKTKKNRSCRHKSH